MSNSRLTTVLLLIACLAVFSMACKKNKQPEIIPEPPVEAPAPEPERVPVKEVIDNPIKPIEQPKVDTGDLTVEQIERQLQTIYFDFDRFELSAGSRSALQGNADVLKLNRKYNVVVGGHCDERGSIEYNLALGERRAKATRDYLVTLGVPASRVRIVSYGEEKPADRGHGESAWAKNRRAEFTVER